MIERKSTLSDYSESQREKALKKYHFIEPALHKRQSLREISNQVGIPLRTLYRWKRSFVLKGLVGLIHKTRTDLGTVRIDHTIQTEVKNLAVNNKHISIATIHRKIRNMYKEKNIRVPSYNQVYKIVKRIDPHLIELSHSGEKKYKEKYDLIYRREASRPNQIWQADHTLLDIVLIDEKGNPARPWLTIILDDYSRAVAGYNLDFASPNAIRTALTLHQAIWNKKDFNWTICGIPELFYTDHGSDFTSYHMEQVAIDLRINLIYSSIGVPRGRGKIERFFRTVNQLFLENLSGYTKNPKEQGVVSIQEFRAMLHNFLIMEYNHKKHSATNETPMQRWAKQAFLPNMPDSLEKLDLLLLQLPKTRKVHPDGIHFNGFRYTNSNLVAYVGEYVVVRYDPTDLVEIRVFYKNSFLCTCISPELSDYSIGIQDITYARNKRKNILKKKLQSPSTIDILISEKQAEQQQNSTEKKSKLKRYYNV